jgi:hypothetical protein
MPKLLRLMLCIWIAGVIPGFGQAPLASAEEPAKEKRELLEKSLSLYELDREIASLETKEKQLAVRIDLEKRNVEEAERKAKEARHHAGKVIRSYYTGDRETIWLAALSAQSIGDAIYIIEQLQIMIERDRAAIAAYLEQYRSYKHSVAMLELEMRTLAAVKAAYAAEKERRLRLNRELEAGLAASDDREQLEREIRQIQMKWEQQGLPLFEQYFSALAKVMQHFPDLVMNSNGALSLKGKSYTLKIGDEELNRFIHSKDKNLSGFAFQFGDDLISAGGTSGDNAISLTGRYEIENGKTNAVRFRLDKLVYNGFELPDTTAKSLESKFDLSFYPQKIVPFIQASEIRIEPGYLTVILKLSI